MMLFLLRLDPLVPELPPFKFEMRVVVDSLAELPKCVCTQNKQEPEAPTRNRENQILRFGKSEGLVSSGPAAVRGTSGSDEGILILVK
jgi:hypothetical protein